MRASCVGLRLRAFGWILPIGVIGLAACAAPGAVAETTPALVGTAGPGAGVFDVGGRGLFLQCGGVGTPVVVLEAGLGGSSEDWWAVLPALSEETRVCAYDRAGLGLSDPPRLRPRTS